MKLRFLGAEPAYVTALNRIVEPDEQVDVPDELVHDPDNPTDKDGNPVGLLWPEALWAEVTPRQAKPKTRPEPAPVATQEG